MFELIKTNGRLSGFNVQIQTKSGIKKHLEISAEIIVLENIECVLEMVLDVTEQRRAEDTLKEERRLLRTLIDTVPDFVYVKDLQGRKIISNKADWQASGGKTMEDVLGKSDFDFYPADWATRFWADDKSVLDTGTPVINREEYGTQPGF